jgi:predicted nucleic acid-binding protein
MNKVLLDTDTYSEITKGIDQTVKKRKDAYFAIWGYYTISVLTVMEIYKGFKYDPTPRNLNKLQDFVLKLPSYEVLPLDIESAKIAGFLYADLKKKGKKIGRADPFIAAIAIQKGLTLATGNTEHYTRIKDLGYPLTLENWRE